MFTYDLVAEGKFVERRSKLLFSKVIYMGHVVSFSLEHSSFALRKAVRSESSVPTICLSPFNEGST